MPSSKPNFVFILTDQQRRDSLGCYGNPVIRTPNLDRLAGEGVVFENSFTANVVCMPSRASLLTGRYPRAHRLIINGMPLSSDEITLPQVLSDDGYRTAAVGKIHLSPHKEPRTSYRSPEGPEWHAENRPMPMPYYGFQQTQLALGHPDDWTDYYRELKSIDPELPALWKPERALRPLTGAPSSWKSAMPEAHHSSTWVADKAIERLEESAVRDDPFFLFVGFPDPHFPYCPPAPWCDRYDPEAVPMPRRRRDEAEGKPEDYQERLRKFAKSLPYHPMDIPDAHVREIIAHTYGMVSLLDKNVGRIMAALDRLDLTEETVVVFTSDHGEHLGDHWLIYKCAPYDELIRLPMIWRWPGRFPPGSRIPGLFSHVDVMPTMLELTGISNPRGVQGQSFVPALCGQEVQGRPWVFLEDDEADGIGFLRTLRTPDLRISYYLPQRDGELYDLREDPDEFVNRWSDPKYRAVREELLLLMLEAAMQACDPKPERTYLC